MIQEVKDLCWSFSDSQQEASVRYGLGNGYMRVDPTPAYAHDVKYVDKMLKATRRAAGRALRIDVNIYVFHYESLGRSNGWASTGSFWNDEKEKWDKEPQIALMGKRIPIHPAMTRYLVSHEYGHHVEWLLNRHFGFEEYTDDFLDAYNKYRGVGKPRYYGPGQWHLHPQEVFANDFRVQICGEEMEFWPHEVPMLTKRSRLAKWWEKIRTQKRSEWDLP